MLSLGCRGAVCRGGGLMGRRCHLVFIFKKRKGTNAVGERGEVTPYFFLQLPRNWGSLYMEPFSNLSTALSPCSKGTMVR